MDSWRYAAVSRISICAVVARLLCNPDASENMKNVSSLTELVSTSACHDESKKG